MTIITDVGTGWTVAAAFGNPGSPCFQAAIERNNQEYDLQPNSAACTAMGASAPVNAYIKQSSQTSWIDCGSFRWLRTQNATYSAILWIDRVQGQVACQMQEPAF